MATSKVEQSEPTTEWAHDQTFDTLLVFLPGFKKDNLTVQITSTRKLRVVGERQKGDKQSRVSTETLVPSNLDTNKVSARFDGGILYVKFPKVIAPVEPHPTVAPEIAKPPSEPQSQKKDPQQQKADAPLRAEKPDKPKQGDTTPKMLEEEKQEKEGSRQKGMEEEKKPKGAEKPDKGEKPDDDAQKKAAEKEKNQKEKATDFSETSPSEKKEAPVRKPHSSKGQEGEEIRKHRRRRKMDPGNDKKFTGGLLERLQQPRNLVNSIVAVLLVLMLGLYLKQAFRSFAGRQSSDSSDPQV